MFTINSLYYKPTILRIIKYRLKIKTKLNNIKIQRSFGVLNKFLKGVNIINTNPIILLIKNRGYRVIFVQKLFRGSGGMEGGIWVELGGVGWNYSRVFGSMVWMMLAC